MCRPITAVALYLKYRFFFQILWHCWAKALVYLLLCRYLLRPGLQQIKVTIHKKCFVFEFKARMKKTLMDRIQECVRFTKSLIWITEQDTVQEKISENEVLTFANKTSNSAHQRKSALYRLHVIAGSLLSILIFWCPFIQYPTPKSNKIWYKVLDAPRAMKFRENFLMLEKKAGKLGLANIWHCRWWKLVNYIDFGSM